ncbi:peroxin-19 [Cryptococcus neoformans var. grubii Br795]|nr:peroxin-19 [Cryptococcus neoformans var. grubii AD1-83a]OXG33791.1 peroxin-19 [Cryptococcus neoformans var. grubii Bt15]OXG60672.1 peroxin-19 [Cryptococcus neoformans var. grubii MW-RSA1955]OXG64159.1 peroxin-19 [Cryptococcus neoformans var. grubii c8]OXG65557.1 peroxin-19 [Cryptococcus neoformans var. grubii CHC193]OXG82377.1 peroxin-19 [Cryptococcus neoformans var. grubii MW-RSA36]OXG83411.1 peroxin-19 [Cryptococcus neoformans var. grubii Br795]OXG88420.1 peroxin-19 [Cryptococcus neofor
MMDESSKHQYRDPQVTEEDEEEEDLSDLDNVLESFQNSRPSASTFQRNASLPSATQPRPSTPPPGEDDEDFEASLMQGMESLLRQLAGDHPPGVMPDIGRDGSPKPTDPKMATSGSVEPSPLSKEAEEAAWQNAVDTLLSGEGLAALGLDESTSSRSKEKPSSEPPSLNGTAPKPSYEDTLRKTLESLKSAGQNSGGRSSAAKDGQNDIASLFASLGGDPDLLKGMNLGEAGGEEDFEGILEGMMAQLMTKEVLEEPMSELAVKYPAYLKSPPPDTSPEDIAKYHQQYTLVTQIVETFKKPGYTDEKDGKDIARLVSEMQDLGGPPKEVMGDLPEGFDLGILGNEDGCTIM